MARESNMSESISNILRTKAQIDAAVSFDAFSGAELFDQKTFLKLLYLERKRVERSSKRFALMLVDAGSLFSAGAILEKIVQALAHSTRETDIKGWHQEGSVIGVLFTEIAATEGTSVAKILSTRITEVLYSTLPIEDINAIKLSFHIFPEDPGNYDSGGPVNSPLYPDLAQDMKKKNGARLMKKLTDILGSLFALILFSPVLLAITVAIRMSSKGPILFRQERVGQFGKKFTFLKFRSMYFANDPTIHKEYTKRLISGAADSEKGQHTVYKLTNDPRVTPVGRFLRRTSLDELPQLFNVLRGEMSLVGPRPPIPYEFEWYSIWQTRRLLLVKPGITGLWQVEGRSRVTFDEMVRLDLRYAKSWSLWLDIKILLRTPRAMFSGDGAY